MVTDKFRTFCKKWVKTIAVSSIQMGTYVVTAVWSCLTFCSTDPNVTAIVPAAKIQVLKFLDAAHYISLLIFSN